MGATAPSSPVLIKIGGRALEREGAAAELATGLAALAGQVVLVHGGGAEVTAWSTRLGHAQTFVDGRRVTDPATLEVATAVLAGLANKRLVAALRDAGVDAVGLAALDGGMVECIPHPQAARLGDVGTIARVAPALIETLLGQGRVPVLASIGAHAGRLLNLNADDLAAALAGALGARALILLSDTPGLMLDGSLARRLTAAQALQALEAPEVKNGMRAKLESAHHALRNGVAAVHIAEWSGPRTLADLLADQGEGTTLVAAETHLV